MRKELIKLWMDYQGSGIPYGNSFEGFMEWLKERELSETSRFIR